MVAGVREEVELGVGGARGGSWRGRGASWVMTQGEERRVADVMRGCVCVMKKKKGKGRCEGAQRHGRGRSAGWE